MAMLSATKLSSISDYSDGALAIYLDYFDRLFLEINQKAWIQPGLFKS
ncbi:hypothetical protein SAMN06265350_10314 [Solitalea koreensis]|uniref:Uncharacterized protein n=1 Tax=Solitalea koreensis TaxID=543615 RepID=A0A521BXN6_9SPHI|nr:hypothetical protein SAMN06265350_10314 [Solitalea koreensis]